jgi:hypothetical protein
MRFASINPKTGNHALSCLTMWLTLILAAAAQTDAPSSVRPSSVLLGVSLAKAAINSERAIAENLTDAWLPCQKSSALQCQHA